MKILEVVSSEVVGITGLGLEDRVHSISEHNGVKTTLDTNNAFQGTKRRSQDFCEKLPFQKQKSTLNFMRIIIHLSHAF